MAIHHLDAINGCSHLQEACIEKMGCLHVKQVLVDVLDVAGHQLRVVRLGVDVLDVVDAGRAVGQRRHRDLGPRRRFRQADAVGRQPALVSQPHVADRFQTLLDRCDSYASV